MKLRALILALMVAACGQGGQTPSAPSEPEPLNPFNMQIEIGRYGVMLSQVGSLTDERDSVAPEADVTAPGEMLRNLRETVWEYNLARSRLCAKGLYTEVACGSVYEPVWLADTAEPSLEELKVRADAVGGEVMRLWNAVCEDARTRETDEQARMYVCAIE